MRSKVFPFKYHRFNLNFIRYSFGEHSANALKHWIDMNYRIIRARSKLQFLKHCKMNNLLPSHLSRLFNTRLHIFHHRSVKMAENVLRKCKSRILDIEIFELHRTIDSLKRDLTHTTFYLSNILPYYIWKNIRKHHILAFRRCNTRLFFTHKKKFEWLLHKTSLNNTKEIKSITFSCITNNNTHAKKFLKCNDTEPFTTTNETLIKVNLNPSSFLSHTSNNILNHTNQEWFKNLSNKNIPVEVSNLLQLGDTFSLPNNINKKNTIHEFIKDTESIVKSQVSIFLPVIRKIAIPQLHSFLHGTTKNTNIDEQINSLLNTTIQFCKNNPDIIFTRADKGNVTVALDKTSYTKNIEEILSDESTYTIIKKNPCKILERNLNETLKNWHKKEYISKKEYFSLHSIDCSLPRAYGLPKIHKPNAPFRIIVSSINTTLYPIARFLQRIISESLPKATSSIDNSFELYNTLSKVSLPESHILVSLDVVSLFTNVPLHLAITSINNRWNFIEKFTKISKEAFISMIKFILSSTYFTFNNVIYKQTFGTPMGSPLSPIISDLVMQDLEEQVLSCLKIKLPFYYRYVDDILLTAPREDINDVVEMFNRYHNRLKFTIEYESNHCLSFLDLLLKVGDKNKIIIDWFHKSTFSGRYLSFFSNHPMCHKIGIINVLVDRAVSLSHPMFYDKNLKLIIRLLLNNGYPLKLVFDSINRRLKNKFVNKLHTIKKPPLGIDKNDDNTNINNNKKNFFVIPYIKPISDMISSVFYKSDTMVGFRCLNKLNRFIKVQKDQSQPSTRNNVVYKINCKDCDASYVGQTKRQLSTRIKEHINNIRLDPSKHSVVSEHIKNFNHTFDWEKTKILDTEPFFHKRLISEMIYIKEQKNGINCIKDTEMLDGSYFNILHELTQSQL